MLVSIGIAAALAATVAWGVGDFFIQRATRKLGDVETLAWIGLVGSIALLPFVWNDLALLFSRSNFFILLVLGLVTFAVGIANFEAFKRGKLAVVDVLLEFELPLTVLLGLLVFKESLSWLQIFLIFTIFVGIVLIAIDPREFKRRHLLEKGAVLALVAAVGYGLINFLTAVGARDISPLLAIWFPWVVFTVICGAWLAKQGKLKSTLRHIKSFPGLIFTIGIVDTLAWTSFALAVEGKELAVTIAITESYPVISLLLGLFVNKEKIFGWQLFGMALTITASVAMGLFS